MAQKGKIYLDWLVIETQEDKQVWRLAPGWSAHREFHVSLYIVITLVLVPFFSWVFYPIFNGNGVYGWIILCLSPIWLFNTILCVQSLYHLFWSFFSHLVIKEKYAYVCLLGVPVKKIGLPVQRIILMDLGDCYIIDKTGKKTHVIFPYPHSRQEIDLLSLVLTKNEAAKNLLANVADRVIRRRTYEKKWEEYRTYQNFPSDRLLGKMGFSIGQNTVRVSNTDISVYKNVLFDYLSFGIEKKNIDTYKVLKGARGKYDIVLLDKQGLLHHLGLYFLTKESAEICIKEIMGKVDFNRLRRRLYGDYAVSFSEKTF